MGESPPSETAQEQGNNRLEAGTCLILFPDGYVGVAPTIKNLAEMLAEAGFRVTIIGWRTPYPPPARLNPAIRMRVFRRPWDVAGARTVENVLRRVGLRSVITGVELFWFLLRSLPAIVSTRLTRGPGAIIGVDTIGSIVASLTSAMARTPFAYLSLELPSYDRFEPISWAMTRLERYAFRRADFVAIQDADRLETINRHFGIRHPRPILLPNSPRGVLDTSIRRGRSLLRDRLGISEVDFPTIVLHAGMIEDATYCRELAAAFAHVGGGCALVFHDRVTRRADDPYLVALKRLNSRNLFLSLEPVDIDDLDAVFASASIGLAFYRDLGPNFTQIAKASGKLAYYMKHGVPMVTNNIPSLATFVSENEVGVVVKDPTDASELSRAIDRVRTKYDTFSRNARRVFAEQFDFDVRGGQVVDRLRAKRAK